MNDLPDNIERLISRYLDDEADAGERRQLTTLVRRDPQAAALFDEQAALDREISIALRKALRRPLARPRRLRVWPRVFRTVGVAAAACLAAVFWTQPQGAPPAPDGTAHGSFGVGRSWFAPPPASVDTLVDTPDVFERPGVHLRAADRNWIVVPGDAPGEFLIVEVKRVRTRTVHVQQDF